MSDNQEPTPMQEKHNQAAVQWNPAEKIPFRFSFAGKVPVEQDIELDKYFDVLMSIAHQPENLLDAIKHTAESLRFTVRQIGKMIQINPV